MLLFPPQYLKRETIFLCYCSWFMLQLCPLRKCLSAVDKPFPASEVHSYLFDLQYIHNSWESSGYSSDHFHKDPILTHLELEEERSLSAMEDTPILNCVWAGRLHYYLFNSYTHTLQFRAVQNAIHEYSWNKTEQRQDYSERFFICFWIAKLFNKTTIL